MRQFNAPILINTAIAPNWMHLAFEWPSGLPEPAPGQFFTVLPTMVELGAGTLLRRPLAFAGFEPAKDTKNAVAHSIYQIRGHGTKGLSIQTPGSAIDVIGPLGNVFPPSQRGEKTVIAGGGIGIGPMLFLASWLSQGGTACGGAAQDEAAQGGQDVLLALGFRSASLIPFRAEAGGTDESPMAEQWRRLLARARFATDDGTEGLHGTLVDALEVLWNREAPPRAWHLYGCGPGPMLAALAKFAAARTLPAHFSAEQWMACGVGACQGCVIPTRSGDFVRVCADGPVFEADTIDWEACLR